MTAIQNPFTMTAVKNLFRDVFYPQSEKVKQRNPFILAVGYGLIYFGIAYFAFGIGRYLIKIW